MEGIWCGKFGCQKAMRLPNDFSASYDILRLYDLHQPVAKHSSVPFLIVPGHRTGVISQLYLDPSCRFLISTAGTRGWEGNSTQVLLGYEIGCD
jgi:transcriptional activator SPT8